MTEIKATMSGSVWKVEVKENDEVREDDVLVILESMKMEIPIESTEDGIVDSLKVSEGDFIQEDDTIATIREN